VTQARTKDSKKTPDGLNYGEVEKYLIALANGRSPIAPEKMGQADEYILEVHTGTKLVSSWVKQQVDRHVNDLVKSTQGSGLYFSRTHAEHALKWLARNATITEDGLGVTVGDKLVLQPWQRAFITILFGWRRLAYIDEDGKSIIESRRFRNVYAELARGNGKSKLASAIALYVLVGEGIKGAAVYSVATTMEQAAIVFHDAALMATNRTRTDLRSLVHNKNLLFIPGTATVCRPLASDEKSLDGLKPNLTVVDELHAHTTRGVWNKCKTAQGKKPGSIMLAITTAGFDRHSVCYEQRTYAEKVLNGELVDDSYFVWICALDKSDDPFDRKNWYKSNPNLGVSIEMQTIVDAAAQAQVIPTEYNDFLRLRCNIWTESSVRWMPPEYWAKAKDKILEALLAGRPCFGGMDLSTVTDISAFVLVFPPWGDDPYWRVLPHFYVPEENVAARVKTDRVPYDAWIRAGLITVTPGIVIDFDYIRLDIQRLAAIYDIQEIGHDPWNAHQIVNQLAGDGFVMSEVRQGHISMNSPMKFLMEKVLKEEIKHGGNEVLTWMMGNTVADIDPAGSIKPDKKKSTEKIDGVTAMLCAIARASVTPVIKKKTTFTAQVWG
jgi:phage terminase large subunit-like protein